MRPSALLEERVEGDAIDCERVVAHVSALRGAFQELMIACK